MEFAFLIIGLLVGATASWIVVRSRLATDVTRLRLELEHERSVADEKVGVLTQAREQLSMQLQAMCAEALRGNSEQFMQLARAQFEQLQLKATHDLDSRQKAVESLVTPIKESLEKVNTEVKTLETARIRDVTRLSTLLTTVAETNDRLRTETNSLVTALRAPSVHGRWGELQLKNAVEAAGMLAYCDFVVQATGRGDPTWSYVCPAAAPSSSMQRLRSRPSSTRTRPMTTPSAPSAWPTSRATSVITSPP